jgi:thiaminase/transcriptional activator TenA
LSFIDEIQSEYSQIREGILAHPFIAGVGNGSLNVENFKHYVLQDYVYLVDYSRVLAIAVARAPDLDTMSWFAGLLYETLNAEMDLHRAYCLEFGISRQQLENTIPSPTTISYTSFLLKTAYQGTFGELIAALLPCQLGYWEIGQHLSNQGKPYDAPLYSQWIDMYSSKEFGILASTIGDLANRIYDIVGHEERLCMKGAYLTGVRFEHLFWDMAYNLEQWSS